MEYQSERITLAKLDLKPKTKFRYKYDFGDSRIYEITVEKVVIPEVPLTVPVCLAGKRACPPEDSGGPRGFQDMLYAARNPDHPDHKEYPDWDPEAFYLEAGNVCAALYSAKSFRRTSSSNRTRCTGADQRTFQFP